MHNQNSHNPLQPHTDSGALLYERSLPPCTNRGVEVSHNSIRPVRSARRNGAVSSRPQAGLGNTAKHSSHEKNFEQKADESARLVERLDLRKHHAALVGGARRRAGIEKPDRAELCMTAPLAKDQAFTVTYQVDSDKNSVHGFQTCGKWNCPYCAHAKARRHALELRVWFDAAAQAGHHIFVVTLTGQHFSFENGAAVFDDMLEAKDAMFSGRWWQECKRERGIFGHVRHVENTWGLHAHHPHLHIVFETDQEPTEGWMEQLEELLTQRWIGILAARGRGGLPGVAVKVTRGHELIEVYLSKLGMSYQADQKQAESLSHELASAPTKKGRGDSSFSMFELLRISAGLDDATRFALLFTDGDLDAAKQRAGEVWLEYCAMIKGRQLVVWSNGLKQQYQVEETADQREREEQGPQVELGVIIDGWQALREPAVFAAVRAAGLNVVSVCEAHGMSFMRFADSDGVIGGVG